VREAQLDPSFVCDWTCECDADRGRPSIDSIVFFTLQLAVFFEGTRSERKLIETASLNLAQRWNLGYALDKPLPTHFRIGVVEPVSSLVGRLSPRPT